MVPIRPVPKYPVTPGPPHQESRALPNLLIILVFVCVCVCGGGVLCLFLFCCFNIVFVLFVLFCFFVCFFFVVVVLLFFLVFFFFFFFFFGGGGGYTGKGQMFCGRIRLFKALQMVFPFAGARKTSCKFPQHC